jgi:hypothetical protein
MMGEDSPLMSDALLIIGRVALASDMELARASITQALSLPCDPDRTL